MVIENKSPDSELRGQISENSPASLAEVLGIKFNNPKILEQALLHSSYANENPTLDSYAHNERLEFLGDAILGFVICDYLFTNFPSYPEGELTKIKSLVVSKPVLAQIARKLNLGNYLILGHGEGMTGGRKRDSILSNALESLFGAIYLDQGIEPTRKFIIGLLQEAILRPLLTKEHHDYKTLLQEYSQRHHKVPPKYRIVNEKGPDHAKIYSSEVLLANVVKGSGQGSSKKEAEQNAAKIAYELIAEIEKNDK